MDSNKECAKNVKTRIQQIDPNMRRKVNSAPVPLTSSDFTDFDSDIDDACDNKGPETNKETLTSCLVETSEIDGEREIRIVLVGKTGAGKSATGNTLLGEEIFKSMFSGQSVTDVCCRGESVIDGRKLVVVDTPGLFDTKLSKEEIEENIIRCVHMSIPGPHIFLIVLRVGRFTKEERDSLNHLFEIFGDSMKQCSILVFTGLDSLESDSITGDEFIKNAGEPLSKYIEHFNGRYIVINNKAQNDIRSSMAKSLLKLMETTVKRNEGKCYSNELVHLAKENIARVVGSVKEQYQKRIEEIKKELEEKQKNMIEEVRNLAETPNLVENRRNQVQNTLDVILMRKAEEKLRNEEIQIHAAMKISEIQTEQKRKIKETIKKITEDTSKEVSYFLHLVKEKNEAIKKVRENIKKAVGDTQAQKLLAEEEQKLNKEKNDIIRERDQCISEMMHKSSVLQKQLRKKDNRICPIM